MILLDQTFLLYLLNDTIFLARKEVAMEVELEKTSNGRAAFLSFPLVHGPWPGAADALNFREPWTSGIPD